MNPVSNGIFLLNQTLLEANHALIDSHSFNITYSKMCIMNVTAFPVQHLCAVSITTCIRVQRNTRGFIIGHCIIRLVLISNPHWLMKCQFSAHHDGFPVVGCRQHAAVGRSSSSCISGNGAIAQLGSARYATANCWLLLCPSTQTTPTGASPPAQTGTNSPGSHLTKQPWREE